MTTLRLALHDHVGLSLTIAAKTRQIVGKGLPEEVERKAIQAVEAQLRLLLEPYLTKDGAFVLTVNEEGAIVERIWKGGAA